MCSSDDRKHVASALTPSSRNSCRHAGSSTVVPMRRAFIPRVVPVLLVAILVCAACGASARTQTLRVSLITLNVARDTMRATSKEREAQIVAHATTKEEGRAQLDAWRATVDKIAAAIEDGYRAIYGAAILDDVKSASDAGAAVAKALALLKDIQNPTKPVTPVTPAAPSPATPPATPKEATP